MCVCFVFLMMYCGLFSVLLKGRPSRAKYAVTWLVPLKVKSCARGKNHTPVPLLFVAYLKMTAGRY